MQNNNVKEHVTDKETAAKIQMLYKKNYQIIIKEDLQDLNPTAIGEAELPAYRATDIRNQISSFLYHSCRGCGQLLLNGRSFVIKEGDFFIIPVGAEASLYCEVPWTYTWIGFTGTRASEFFSFPTVFTLPEDVADRLYDIGTPERNLASRLTSDLFLIHSKLRAPRQNEPDYIQKLVNKINVCYMQKLSVSQMAEELGINRRISLVYSKAGWAHPYRNISFGSVWQKRGVIFSQAILLRTLPSCADSETVLPSRAPLPARPVTLRMNGSMYPKSIPPIVPDNRLCPVLGSAVYPVMTAVYLTTVLYP